MPANTTSTALRKRSPKYLANVPKKIGMALHHGVAKRRLMRSVSAVSQSVMKAGGSRIRPRRMTYKPPPIAAAIARYCSDSSHGTVAPNTVEAKPISRNSADAADGAEHRERAALPRRARRAEIGIGDHDERERIKRGHQPVVQFGAELTGLLEVELIFRVGKQQLPEIALADRILHRLGAAGELRKIERVSVEGDHGRIALAGFVPLHDPFLQNQEGAVVVVEQLADFGKNGDAFVRIAPVVEENAGELAVRCVARGCEW